MMHEEFEKDGLLYIRETYENGLIAEYIKPSEEVTSKETVPTPDEEKISLDEKVNKLATSILALEDAVATMYEDDKKRSVQVDETLATIYEALTDKGENK